MVAKIYWSLLNSGPAETDWQREGSLDFLSAAEHQILAGLRFERRRSEWLSGRWTAKNLVKSVAIAGEAYPLSSFSILNEDAGAPYVMDAEMARIEGCLSISHRGGVIACAWTNSDQARIGIDVELVETRDPSFLTDYFTEAEQSFARALPGEVKDVWVTLAWSAKEAILKAMRTGLRIDTRRIPIGQARGLFLDNAADNVWRTLAARSEVAQDTDWQVCWQKRDPFVITLAFAQESFPGGMPEIKERLVQPPF